MGAISAIQEVFGIEMVVSQSQTRALRDLPNALHPKGVVV